MRKILLGVILTGNVFAVGLSAEESGKQFRLYFGYDSICDAEFKDTEEHDGEELKYSRGEATLAGVVCYNPCNEEGLVLILGYTNTEIDWGENPFFDQTCFNTARVGIGGFSNRICDWMWQGSVILNADTDHFDLERYLTWDLLLWGRYQYNSCIGLHLGFYAETGMMVDHVYPVIGFDWAASECWKVNAIFPMDISAIYTINQNWSAVGAVRFFHARHRVGKDEELERAIVTYKNSGTELALLYDCADWASANVHVGYANGGRLKVADRDYSNREHFRFKASPYIGGEVKIAF